MSDNLQDPVFDDHPAAGFRPAVAAILARAVEQACEELLQLCARDTAKALMPGDRPKGEPARSPCDPAELCAYCRLASSNCLLTQSALRRAKTRRADPCY